MLTTSKVNEEVRACRVNGGYVKLNDFSLVELSGKDACSYLHGRTSNDVNGLESGQGQYSAFLDRKGYLIAYVSIHKLEGRLLIFSMPAQGALVLKELETYHFRESLEYSEKAGNYAAYALLGPNCNLVLEKLGLSFPWAAEHSIAQFAIAKKFAGGTVGGACGGSADAGCSESDVGGRDADAGCRDADAGCTESDAGCRDADAGCVESDAGGRDADAGCVESDAGGRDAEYPIRTVVLIKRSLSGDDGFILLIPKSLADSFADSLNAVCLDLGFSTLSSEALEVLRIEAGLPKFGSEISAEFLLPETGLEQVAASYNKGCFQGQEILARIKTYGAPRRALVGLLFENEPEFELPANCNLKIHSEDAGCIKSSVYSDTFQKTIAMAYIARDFRVPEKELEIEADAVGRFKVKVKFLPFYSAESRKAKARQLYDGALQEFAHGSESKAAGMLREVIDLDPHFADAYESLGVILSRLEQFEEALALMHKLQALDPGSVMAHTNLSVYYMHLGDKERAEEEKAIAMSLRMSQIAREHAQKKQEEVDRQKQSEESEKRLAMFRQVLEIDPDDFLANNGVGTVYVELGKYEEAILYLRKCIEVKPTHTVAYLALGQALANLSRFEEAKAVYESGIELAAKRGDLTPMKEMQMHLAKIP